MPRCECFCARDVGVLLRAPAYICLAVCRLGSNGRGGGGDVGEFGRMGCVGGMDGSV